MTQVFLITARLKSKRLKNKIMRRINGVPIIQHMVNRVKKSKYFNNKNIIICTSFLKSDNQLVNYCKTKKIKYFLGDPDDVIKRLYDAAMKFNAKDIINITADCPLVEPQYIDETLEILKKKNFDLVRSYGLPHGSFCYGIKRNSLRKVLEIKNSCDTEVWERYFVETGFFNVHDMKIKNKLHFKPGLRLTLDYMEDLILLRKIFNFFKNRDFFDLSDIINLLDKKKYLIQINKKFHLNFMKHYKKKFFLSLKKGIKLKVKYAVKNSFIEYVSRYAA